MDLKFLALTGIVLYSLTLVLQSVYLIKKQYSLKYAAYIFALLGVALHAWLLYHIIIQPDGYDLSGFHVLSIVVWLSAFLIVFSVIRFPIFNLLFLIGPLAILSLLGLFIFSIGNWHQPYQLLYRNTNFQSNFHIIISLLCFGFLAVAALQALLLNLQNYYLHHKKFSLIQALPSLQIMESFLFQTIIIGFVLLSITLVSAIIFFHDTLTPYIIQKFVLTFLSWLTFLGFLIGRYAFNWRGKIAIRSTLVGFIILFLAYFISGLFLTHFH